MKTDKEFLKYGQSKNKVINQRNVQIRDLKHRLEEVQKKLNEAVELLKKSMANYLSDKDGQGWYMETQQFLQSFEDKGKP